jgi:hypothetical protein
MSIEDNLEQTLFERGAEKCDSKDSRLAFCKTYLEKHNVYPKEEMGYTAVENSLISKEYGNQNGMREVAPVNVTHVRKIIDNYTLNQSPSANMFIEKIKIDLVDKLTYDMIEKGRIHFEVFRHPAMDTTEVHAAVKVADWKR